MKLLMLKISRAQVNRISVMKPVAIHCKLFYNEWSVGNGRGELPQIASNASRSDGFQIKCRLPAKKSPQAYCFSTLAGLLLVSQIKKLQTYFLILCVAQRQINS